jgi:hypothetical protein
MWPRFIDTSTNMLNPSEYDYVLVVACEVDKFYDVSFRHVRMM